MACVCILIRDDGRLEERDCLNRGEALTMEDRPSESITERTTLPAFFYGGREANENGFPLTRPQSWNLIYSDLEECNDLYGKQVNTTQL